LLAVVATITRVMRPAHGSGPRRLHECLSAAIWAVAGFSIPTLAAWFLLKINLAAVWWLNLNNHAGFYRQYPRTYWKWLLVNPVEFAVAAGVPLAVLAMWSIVRNWRMPGEYV